MCGIELVLLLLLLIFCDTLLLYSLTLSRTNYCPGIPVRGNTLSTPTQRSRVGQRNGRRSRGPRPTYNGRRCAYYSDPQRDTTESYTG